MLTLCSKIWTHKKGAEMPNIVTETVFGRIRLDGWRRDADLFSCGGIYRFLNVKIIVRSLKLGQFRHYLM